MRQPTADELKALLELIQDFNTCMLTTVDESGLLYARVMTLQEPQEGMPLWFVASLESDAARHLATFPQVNVALHRGSDHAWVSIAGTAEVLTDDRLVDRLWQDDWKMYFSRENGHRKIALIKVRPVSVTYWKPEQSRLGVLFDLFKARFSEEGPDLASPHTFELNEQTLESASSRRS